MKRHASRIDAIKPAASIASAQEAKRLRAAGHSIVDLSWGEPYFDTPEPAREAAIRAIGSGATHYTPAAGIPELREGLARYLRSDRAYNAEPDEIHVTPGGKLAAYAVLQAYAGPGDEVLAPSPCWLSYEDMANLGGARLVHVPGEPAAGYVPTRESLEASVTDRTRVLLLNSPSNPTGAVWSKNALQAAVDVAVEHDLLILSDEVYGSYVFDREHVSPATLDGARDRTIILDSFSKRWSMTGWRVGFLAAPRALLAPVATVLQHTATCAPSISQHAALGALEGAADAPHAFNAEVRQNRDALMAALDGLPGVRLATRPEGAFYALVDVAGRSGTGERAASELLHAGVAVVPGSAYGPAASNCIRLAYALPRPTLDDGLARLRGWALEGGK